MSSKLNTDRKKIVDKILYLGVYKLHAKNFKLQSIASQKSGKKTVWLAGVMFIWLNFLTVNEWHIEDKLMELSVT